MSENDAIKKYLEDINRLNGTPQPIENIFDGVDPFIVMRLLKDEEDLSHEQLDKMSAIKEKIINRENIDLSNEDVLSDIKMLEENIPDNLTPLEKVRWIYINLGKLFSYDYRVAQDPFYGYEKEIDIKKFVGRYQTCVQISEILFHVLNKIEGVKCRIIPRSLKNERGQYGQDHVANEVYVDDNGYELKILLDLTLDLYLIQADCLTKHFGFEDDGSGTYDIIPQAENKKMDKKLGFSSSDEDYTDDIIYNLKESLNKLDLSELTEKEYIDMTITLFTAKLNKKFPGYHEGKRYIQMLFDEMLHAYYREFNLFYSDEEGVNLKTVYRITLGDYEKWIIYNNRFGFISTTVDKLRDMLNNGWMTNSETLKDILEESKENKKQLV